MTRRWRSSSWTVEAPPERIRQDHLEEMAAKVPASLPDDTLVTVKITAGEYRALLAAHERRVVARGAEIVDENRRVTYRTTIGRGLGRVWLRSVEVLPWDEEPDPGVWRVSPVLLSDETSLVLAEQDSEARRSGDDASDVILLDLGTAAADGGPATPEELVALLRAGETRRTIAARYGRKVPTVDGWLNQARRSRPDLPWPRQRRGPKPGTTSKRARAASKTTSSTRTARGAGRRGEGQQG